MFLLDLPEFQDLDSDDIRVTIENHYCLEQLTLCNPDRKDTAIFECQACMEFDVKCRDVSEQHLVDVRSGDPLMPEAFPRGTGICVVGSEHPENYNPKTTNVLVGVVRSGAHILATTTTQCVNQHVVGKDITITDLAEYMKAPCHTINACHPNGVMVHPYTGHPITDVITDIDFDLTVPDNLRCACPPGFRSQLTVHGAPSCVPDTPIPECSVRWATSTESTMEGYSCICNPALHVNLRDVVTRAHIRPTSAYGPNNLADAHTLYYDVTDRRDHCLPLPGVDGKNAAFSYNALSEKTEGISPGQDVVGGHLLGSALLVKDGIKTVGTYAISNYVRGGVVTVRGNGSIPAYLEGENRYRDETAVMEGGGEPPNHAFRVVPSPPFGVSGLGEASGEHTVGLLCSTGKVYPCGVYDRNGHLNRKTGVDETKRFFDPECHHDIFMRQICDPGIVAGAYLVCKNFPKEQDFLPPSHLRERILGSLDYRRASHTYDLIEFVEYILGKYRDNDETSYLRNFRDVFNSRTIYEGLGEDLIPYFGAGGSLADTDPLGGLFLQPTPIIGQNAWMKNYVAEELWASAVKITDFYRGGKHVYGGLIDPEWFEVSHIPETKVLLGHKEGVLTNYNSHATGLSLQQFTGQDVRYMDKDVIDFVETQVHGTENYVRGMSLLNLPPNSPLCFPELVNFSERNTMNKRTELLRFRNQYASLRDDGFIYGDIENFLSKRYAYDRALKPVCTKPFIVERTLGRGLVHPTPAALEAYIQVNNQTNARLINVDPDMDNRGVSTLINFSQHCSNFYPYMVTHYKFLLNGDAWMGASLNQYVPIFTLKDHTSFPQKGKHDSHHYLPTIVTDKFTSPFGIFTNTCGCTHELVCNKYSSPSLQDNIVSRSFPSRGTRHSVYLFQKIPPTSHVGRYSAYTAAMSNVPLPTALENLFNTPVDHTTNRLPQAPNRFAAFPQNGERMSYMYGRQVTESFPTGYEPTTDGLPPISDGDDSFELFYPKLYENPDRTRFLESLCTVAPSTIRANMLNSLEDGAGDVVMQFGASAMAGGAVFFVHNYPVRLPTYAGYECGQVAAEAMHGFGGYICPYRPWQEGAAHLSGVDPLFPRNDTGEMYDDQFFTASQIERKNVKSVTCEFLRHYGSGMVLMEEENGTSPMCSRFTYGAFSFTRQLTDQTNQARIAMHLAEEGNIFCMEDDPLVENQFLS